MFFSRIRLKYNVETPFETDTAMWLTSGRHARSFNIVHKHL